MKLAEKEEVQPKLFKQRYRLRKHLESGGLTEIYLADDLLFQRGVMVNIIYPEITADPSYLERLEAEARMASILDHPNIARAIDWGDEDGLYFLIGEYTEGRSLLEFLSTKGKLPPSRATRIAAEVCAALELAHGRNLVHGGLSPQNIIIDEIGQVKLQDFGMAWAASGRGYPQYISPEQIQRLEIDGRSDIYSLGIILYQALTGRVPFDEPDIRATAYRHLNEVPVSPSVIDPSIPASLNAIVMKALSKNPLLRYQTAKEMHDALLLYVDGVAPSEAVYVEKSGTIPPWLWAVITAVALLAIGGIVLAILLTRGTEITVPSIIGMSEAQAAQTIEQDGLSYQQQDSFITSTSQPVGVVIDQNPAPGTKLNKNGVVIATVSRELRMPDVMGQSQVNAENTLRGQGINNIQKSNVPTNDQNHVGKVIQQTPGANALITPDTVVTLQIGQQPNLAIVPNVVDLDQNTAIQQLQNASLRVSVVQQQSQTVPQGRVISQSPAAGQRVARDTTVVIVISQAPPGSSG
ncbi:MAG: hypothetical protein A2W01_10020 [Candidatus Solincola sediminis]|nr:MAG: hypothetical protein A2W01_10020 [Candidatus Solincola sediminis]